MRRKISLGIFIIFYCSFMILVSDMYSGYFVAQRINATQQIDEVFTIAIIDTSFDLEKFPATQIVNPLNVEDNNHVISKTPTFDYSGNLTYQHHGTSIMDLFIGKNGFLKNAQIIPIQIRSSEHLEKALNHAKDNNAQIITISLGFASAWYAFPSNAKLALLETSQTIPILIAAGNENAELENTNYGKSLIQLATESNKKIWIIGATKLSFLRSISSYGISEVRANFSNHPISVYGNDVFMWAPGENVVLGSLLHQMFSTGVSGTSIATPLAAIKAIHYATLHNTSIADALIAIQKI